MIDAKLSCSAVALVVAVGWTTAAQASDLDPAPVREAPFSVAQSEAGPRDVDFSFDYSAGAGDDVVDVALPESEALSEEDRSFFGRFLDRFNSRAGLGSRDVSLDKSESISGDEISRDRSFDASGDGFVNAFKFKRVGATVCRHRWASSKAGNSLLQNKFPSFRRPRHAHL